MIPDARPLDAAIIAVGSELLTPTRIDTNSLYVTEVLNDLGLTVAFKAIVGDHPAELSSQIAHVLARHRVLILTGGLGPTDDDLTRDVVAAHLGLPLEEDPIIIDAMERRFAARGWRMPDVNRRQAQVPRGATVLANPHGTAPGLWIEHQGALIALLPGPPREMKPMMDGDVRARLAAHVGGVRLLRRVIRVAGRGESAVEEVAQPVYTTWLKQSPPIETTILAGLGQVELHLSTQSTDRVRATATLDTAVAQIEAVLGADLVSSDGRIVEAVEATCSALEAGTSRSLNPAREVWRRRGSPTWPAAPTTSSGASSPTATRRRWTYLACRPTSLRIMAPSARPSPRPWPTGFGCARASRSVWGSPASRVPVVAAMRSRWVRCVSPSPWLAPGCECGRIVSRAGATW